MAVPVCGVLHACVNTLLSPQLPRCFFHQFELFGFGVVVAHLIGLVPQLCPDDVEAHRFAGTLAVGVAELVRVPDQEHPVAATVESDASRPVVDPMPSVLVFCVTRP